MIVRVRRSALALGIALGLVLLGGTDATAAPRAGQFCSKAGALAKASGGRVIECQKAGARKRWVVIAGPPTVRTVARSGPTVTVTAVGPGKTTTTTATTTVTVTATTARPVRAAPIITAAGEGGNCRYFVNMTLYGEPVTSVAGLAFLVHKKASPGDSWTVVTVAEAYVAQPGVVVTSICGLEVDSVRMQYGAEMTPAVPVSYNLGALKGLPA